MTSLRPGRWCRVRAPRPTCGHPGWKTTTPSGWSVIVARLPSRPRAWGWTILAPAGHPDRGLTILGEAPAGAARSGRHGRALAKAHALHAVALRSRPCAPPDRVAAEGVR